MTKFYQREKKINKWGFLIYEEMKKKPCKLIYNSAMCFLDTLKFWIKFYARPHWLDQRSMVSIGNTLINKNMNERELAREFFFWERRSNSSTFCPSFCLVLLPSSLILAVSYLITQKDIILFFYHVRRQNRISMLKRVRWSVEVPIFFHVI